MLSKHKEKGVIEGFEVQRDIIKKLHHACYQPERHEGHGFFIL
jgi:hypothetical protein